MSRTTLPEKRLHPDIRKFVAENHRDVVDEVEAAVAGHKVVVVGMAQNPHVRKARKLLDRAGAPYHYLEYGSYMNQWRRRNALKMWAGWPTFPMVFVNGQLIGGAADLSRMIKSGAFEALLAEPYGV
ncbi:MAG: glutaredoxin domain-containing protein [Nevskiales bacterium]|nr:glutaredoxin domain-containing protein [Nevskiales bacterium]